MFIIMLHCYIKMLRLKLKQEENLLKIFRLISLSVSRLPRHEATHPSSRWIFLEQIYLRTSIPICAENGAKKSHDSAYGRSRAFSFDRIQAIDVTHLYLDRDQNNGQETTPENKLGIGSAQTQYNIRV